MKESILVSKIDERILKLDLTYKSKWKLQWLFVSEIHFNPTRI